MSGNTLQTKAEAIVRRLAVARVNLGTDQMDDLKGLNTDISELCKAAQSRGDDDARAALQMALDALAEMDAAVREKRDEAKDKLGSAAERKRAVNAYGSGS